MTPVAKEIAVLENLSQSAVAWLCELSPRSIRDAVTLPRDEKRRYDARNVLKWATGRVPDQATLSDNDFEQLLVLREMLRLHFDAQQAAAIELLETLRSKHGDAVFVHLVELLLQEWRDRQQMEADLAEDPDLKRRQAEFERRAAEERAAEENLRLCVVCDVCDRVRRGRRWIQASPPAQHKAIAGRCPNCIDQ